MLLTTIVGARVSGTPSMISSAVFVVLQNRPNVKLVMLDTQVYSNTGGQNSDSSPLPGGFDMNQFGAATEGKLTEMKSVAGA